MSNPMDQGNGINEIQRAHEHRLRVSWQPAMDVALQQPFSGSPSSDAAEDHRAALRRRSSLRSLKNLAVQFPGSLPLYMTTSSRA